MTSASTADNGTAVVILAWTLLAVTTAIIALRFYVKVRIARLVTVDDYLVALAWICGLLQSALLTVAWIHGLGRHYWTLSPGQKVQVMKYMIGFAQVFAVVTSMFGRLSFSAFLLAVIGRIYERRKVILWTVIAVQVVVNAVVVIQIYTQCGSHVSGLWDPEVAAASHCESMVVQTDLGYFQGGTNALCDLILCVLPITILWNLRIPRAQRVGLGAMLTLSIFAFASAVAKTVLLCNLAQSDITWNISTLNLAVVIENNVVMIAATIPTLRSLLRIGRSNAAPRDHPEGGSDTCNGRPSKSSPRAAYIEYVDLGDLGDLGESDEQMKTRASIRIGSELSSQRETDEEPSCHNGDSTSVP